MQIDPLFVLTSQFLLFGLFLFSALQKLSDLSAFRDVLVNYGIARGFIPFIAIFIPVLELGVSLGSLVSLFVQFDLAIIAGISILLLYTMVLSYFYYTGRAIDCGCHFGRSEGTVNGWHLIRNGILIAIILGYFLSPTSRALVWIDYLTAVSFATIIALSLMIVENLRTNSGYFKPVGGRR